MASGGRVGFETVAWFNGGLFDDGATLPLERSDIEAVLAASDLDWSEIDPSILGTLFERGLDPSKRAQLGAHYTDREKILQLVDPVVVRPLLAEWKREKTAVAAELGTRGSRPVARRADETAQRRRASVPDVPDPAARVHGTRSGVRLGELPLPGAAGTQGPRASGADRGGGGPRVPARVPRGRPGEREGHRAPRSRATSADSRPRRRG